MWKLRNKGIEIGDIARLTLREGDMLVLQAKSSLTPEQAERLRTFAESELSGIKVLVLEQGLTMTHLRREEAKAT